MTTIKKTDAEAKIGPFDASTDIRYDKDGLVPVIVQHAATGQVLMFAWANLEAVRQTLTSRFVHLYSRSRGKQWKKGEESGHVQKVERVYYDCDADVLLIQATPTGPACHTNEPSCFYREIVGEGGTLEALEVHAPPKPVLHALADVIASRKGMKPEESYVASLLARAPGKIHEKIAEESGEVIDASLHKPNAEIVHEIADLIFHTWVLMGHHGIAPTEIEAELARRFGVSGHTEKAGRGK